MPSEPDADIDALVRETLAFLTVRPGGEPGTWTGEPPEWFGPYLFGGFVVGQAIIAATREIPDDRRLHSLHAYFLRPASTEAALDYVVRGVRDGRSFSSRRVEVSQAGKPVLDLASSFTEDTDGYVYDLPIQTAVAEPETLPIESGPGPWVAAFLGPTPERSDGTRESTHRIWFRIPARLPDDTSLHAALLGFASDWTGIGGRPAPRRRHDRDGQPRSRRLVPPPGAARRLVALRRALTGERGRAGATPRCHAGPRRTRRPLRRPGDAADAGE